MKYIKTYEKFVPIDNPKVGDYIYHIRWARNKETPIICPVVQMTGEKLERQNQTYIFCEFIDLNNKLGTIPISLVDELRFATPEEIEDFELKRNMIKYNL